MSRKTKRAANKPQQPSSPSYRQMLLDAIGEFICWSRLPQIKAGNIRWTAPLLVTVALLMALDDAEHLKDRFQNARTCARAMFPRLRAPGATYQGWIKALWVVHEQLLAGLCLMLQAAVMEVAAPCWRCGRWVVFAVDGTRVECPMTAANEREFGCAGKDKTTPQLLLTLLLHLGSGLPWAFCRAGGRGSERDHLHQMLSQLPSDAMVVADAGFTGYELLSALEEGGHAFLIRVGANVRLLRKLGFDLRERDSTVYLWPAANRQCPPLVLRLITLVNGRNRRMHLLSNVLDEQALPDQQARELYRMRWAVELTYRSLKQTLSRRKLRSDAPQNAEMELDWAVMGLWLLGLMSLKARLAQGGQARGWSVAASLRVVRRTMAEPRHRGRRCPLKQQLADAVLDGYRRPGPKKARHFARKKTEKPPGDPILQLATETQVQQAALLRSTGIAA
jgi:hypothetical protein